MTSDKTFQIRDYILNLLEDGSLRTNDKIPGARDIAAALKISFLKVQHALQTLSRDGLLETRGRRGTFVQQGWEKRVLHDNVSIFKHSNQLPWVNGLADIMREHIPGLRFTHAFKRGMLELRNTLYVQENHEQFMDMSGLLEECFPDNGLFFEQAFEPFRLHGKLTGIPFAFSPRVLFYNPDLFDKAGCAHPYPGWSWDEFTECARKLKQILPVTRVVNLISQPYYWLNFVMRSGGHIIRDGRVDIGSDECLRGLKLFSELWREFEFKHIDGREYAEDFYSGNAAMVIEGRQFVNLLQSNGMKDWKTVPLPLIPGGLDVTSQATDLLCIRKSCTDMALSREYVRVMLSERAQDYIGLHKYAIPIRKSSAFKSIDLTDPNDSLFAVEMGKLGSEPLAEYPALSTLLLSGLDRILLNHMDIDSAVGELLQASNVFMGIQKHMKMYEKNEEQMNIA